MIRTALLLLLVVGEVLMEEEVAPKFTPIKACAGESKGQKAAIVFLDCLVPEKRSHDRSTIVDIVRIARLYNPTTKIILITASRTAAEQEVLCDLDISLRACAHFADTPAEENFTKAYRHSSVNLYGKELFCFVRFMMLQKLIHEEHYDNVVFADADIFLFSDALAELKLEEGKFLRTMFYSNTYFSMWTPTAVDEFVKFMLHFYTLSSNRTVADIEADIDKYGKHNHKSNEPGFVAQFSDMQMFYAFQQLTTLPNTVDFVHMNEPIRARLMEFSAIISLRVAFGEAKICSPPTETFLNNFIWVNKTLAPYNIDVREPLPRPHSPRGFVGIHFQSPQCKLHTHGFATTVVPLATQLHAMNKAKKH
eukprot:m.243592 g.243592  ORF g.243592 m.243592 type:complete len:365 (+) comp28074_c0_seq1:108-1202(+)